MRDIDHVLAMAPVIPVLVIDRIEDALPIARALVAGGLAVIEVTLRTDAALPAIRAMTRVPGAVVGAGTVLNDRQMDAAIEAGAEFLVSPGLTDRLAGAAAEASIPLLPGVVSASDIMRALEHGFSSLKFFPAALSGGVAMLKGLSAIFPHVRFCPTGGITQESAADWLSLSAVSCVGGSWLVPSGSRPDPEAICQRARAAAALASNR